ncbi:MAG: hypothetical protein IKT39_03400 [Clostridia bacterium]|nr:hypothetical protein [Clostridia bacterium]
MAYSFDFKDNVIYGADDINAIRKSILTKGVVEESADSCKAILSDGVVKICKGQAIFDDGSKIEVDSDGVERQYVSGQPNYVYFLNNTLAGVCEVIVSTAFPENDYVMLAEIDELGEISDKREFTELKTADTQRYIESFSETVSLMDTVGSTATVTLPKSNCSMVEFYMDFASNSWMKINIFPKENGRIYWQYSNGMFDEGELLPMNVYGRSREIGVAVSGNRLTLSIENSTQNSTDIREVKICGYCVR